MMKFYICCSILAFLIICSSLQVDGQNCRSTGVFRGNSPPPGQCSSNCCVQNQVYFTFQCSPTVTTQTMGVLTLRSFANSGGVGPSKCDSQYHSDNELVVALSTGWYSGGSRCGKGILVTANGKTVKARVVDECDSTKGCEATEKYHPPCGYNVVAASRAVWDALGVPPSQRSAPLSITWADA